jgi:predicted hotdog family 3-hydroxylacyl-ACP dehydratase
VASSQEIIAGEDRITGYIPQRPPMVMIGKLLASVDKTTRTSLVIRTENLFVENGFFREPGLIENMAQTAAAGAGYRASIQGHTPSPGFIGGIRELVIRELPRAGDEIMTETEVEHEIFNATVVKARVFLAGRVIASCEMKIFLMDQNNR